MESGPRVAGLPVRRRGGEGTGEGGGGWKGIGERGSFIGELKFFKAGGKAMVTFVLISGEDGVRLGEEPVTLGQIGLEVQSAAGVELEEEKSL